MDTAANVGTAVSRSPKASRSHRIARLRPTAAILGFAILFAATARAADRFAVVITGASGGEAYAKKYDAWRATFVDTLQKKFGYPVDHLFVLAEHESEGIRKATRDNVRQLFADLRKRVTKDDQLLVLLIGHGTPVDDPGRAGA